MCTCARCLTGAPGAQVRFYYSFTSTENLYIVMEYVSGGDTYSLLKQMGALDEEFARVYVAETVLALEYCHTQACRNGLTCPCQPWHSQAFIAKAGAQDPAAAQGSDLTQLLAMKDRARIEQSTTLQAGMHAAGLSLSAAGRRPAAALCRASSTGTSSRTTCWWPRMGT